MQCLPPPVLTRGADPCRYDSLHLRRVGSGTSAEYRQVAIEMLLYCSGYLVLGLGLVAPSPLALDGAVAAAVNGTSPVEVLGFSAVQLLLPTDVRLRYPTGSPSPDGYIAGREATIGAGLLAVALLVILGLAAWGWKRKEEGWSTTCRERFLHLLTLLAVFGVVILNPLASLEDRDVALDLRELYAPTLLLLVPLLAVGGAALLERLDADTPREFYALAAAGICGSALLCTAFWLGRSEQMLWLTPHKLWERDLAANPTDPVALTQSGVELRRSARSSEELSLALRQHEEAVAVEPEGGATLHHYAISLDAAELHAEALEQHEAALALTPAEPKAAARHVAFAHSLVAAEHLEEAEEAFTAAAALHDGSVPASLLTQKGDLLATMERPAEAEQAFAAALGVTAGYPIALHGLAQAQRQQV